MDIFICIVVCPDIPINCVDLDQMLLSAASEQVLHCLNPIALRMAKIVYNFGLSECNRVNMPKRLSGLKVLKQKMPQLY